MVVICPDGGDYAHFQGWISNIAAKRWTHDAINANGVATIIGQEKPSVIARLDGENLFLGKWAGARGICPGCLGVRTLSLRHPHEILAALHNVNVAPRSTAWLTEFGHEVVLSLITSVWESPKCDSRAGFVVHLPTLQIRRFEMRRDSRCAVCASPTDDTAPEAVFSLFHRAKKNSSVYRVVDAEQIHLPLAECLNGWCGFFGVHAVENRLHDYCAQVTGGFRDPSVNLVPMSWSGRTHTYGRSRAIALLEAYERHAGVKMRAKRCAVFDSYRNLKECALDPRECGLHESTFYESTSRMRPFSDDLKVRWMWGYSLTEKRPILVPLQLAYYGDKLGGEPNFVNENSNGCAAGSCLEEAILFALLELIERDAFLMHWYARLSPPRIDWMTIENRDIRLLIERCHRQFLDVFLLDTRLDVRIPSVVAVLLRRDGQLGTFALASSCSFDAQEAIGSALAEVASRVVGFQQRVKNSQARLRPALNDFRLIRTLEDHASFYGLPEAIQHARFLTESSSVRTYQDSYADWSREIPGGSDLRCDIDFCVGLLRNAGLNQIIVVDQTTPEQRELGLCTARVIVPGMIPMVFGHGQCRAARLERLYSVPTKLGLKGIISADEINRVPHPFA